MRTVLTLILFLQAIQSVSPISAERGWRGIVPLHSTRTEVEKLLGPPSETMPGSVVYRTTDETVLVFYSNGKPCGTKGSQWRVPFDTVEAIDVNLRHGLPLSKINLEDGKYKKRSGGDRPEDIYYVNEELGEVFRVFNSEVLDIHYGPASGDKTLRCVPGNDADGD